jgi:hypothetical protein
MILGSVQPSYLAWIPFFERMRKSDIFVYLDDVEYSKNSFHNRNRIKSNQGDLLLTLPVSYKGNSKEFICNMPINNNINWSEKHWRSIEVNYLKSKYFKDLGPLLYSQIYSKKWDKLGDLNISIIEVLKDFVGLEVKCIRSSELNIPGQENEKLIKICKALGANKFIVKPGTESYHPPKIFNDNGIEFEYFTYTPAPYPQLYGDFISNLSMLDYAMNCGPGSFTK